VAVVDPNAAALPPAGTPLPGDGVSVPPADGTVPPLAADMPPQPDMTADASAAAIAAPILADGQAQPTTPTTGVPGADPTALPVVDPLAVANPASASVDSAAPLPNPSVVAAPSVDPAATVAVNTASAPVAAAPSASAPVAAATVPPAPADLVPAQVIEGAKAAPPSADGLVDLKAEQEKAEKAARDAAAQLAQEQEAAKKMEKAATTSSSDPSDVGDVAMPDLPDVEKAVGGKEDFIESTTDFEDLTNATQRRLQLNPEQKAQGLGVSVGEKRKASTKPASPMKSDDGAAPTAEAAPAIDPEAKIAAANRALDLERYQAAFDMFDELYATNQRDERILMGRAVALQKLDRVGEAIQAYDELIALNPNNPDIMINALGLVRKQNPTEALSRLLTLRQKYPTNATVAAQVGLVNAELKNYEDGLRYLNIAADLESTNPKHYFNMAVIAERMARPDLAVRYYEQALKADALAGIERNKLNRDLVYDRLSILRTQLPVGEGGGF
jgi:tetratricopeptide (TPR) repeat protein